jgi:hypothetical protein
MAIFLSPKNEQFKILNELREKEELAGRKFSEKNVCRILSSLPIHPFFRSR